MKNLITPNLNITYRGGWCEAGIEKTVGVSGIYPSAYRAWLNNTQHTNLPPSGLYVPVYLQLPNGPKFEDGQYKGELQGDVAIGCPDGTVAACALPDWNTGLFIYQSLQAYIDDYAKWNNSAVYLGWGEYIGNIKVVEGETMVTNESCYDVFNGILMRPPTELDLNTYVGKWTLDSLISVLNGKLSERQEVLKAYTTGQQALKDDWAGQIKQLSSGLVELKPGNYRVI